jgi:hypothetical protein
MSGRALAAALVVGLTLHLLKCVPQDGGVDRPVVDPRKPSWWPEPPPKDGMPWPPPRPENWEGEWPPLHEVGENPQVWVDLYGEAPNPANDPRFGGRGHAGDRSFANDFSDEVPETDQEPPGCGLKRMRLFAGQFVDSCDPYPVAVSRGLCAQVLNAQAAAARCREICQRNTKEKCTRDRLFTPPLLVEWSCVEGCEEPGAACPQDYANCAAHYLCDCFSN